MAVLKSKKQAIFSELTGQIASQKAVVILTSKDAQNSFDATSNFALRKELRQSGIKIQVVKNTLINKAFESTPRLIGPTFITYLLDGENSDEVTVPKVLSSVVKKYSDNVCILGSVVNGEFYDKTQTLQLANVSTKEESLAQIAGALNAITAKIAISVKEVPASIARGVNAYSKSL